MEDCRFDALTRLVATPRTRRQFVKTLGCNGICKLPAGASGCRANADCCSHTLDGSDVCCGGSCCYTCQGCNAAGPNCAGNPSNIC